LLPSFACLSAHSFALTTANGVKKRKTPGKSSVNVGWGLNRIATGARSDEAKVVAVAVRLGQVGRTVALARGELAVEVRLKPFAVRLVRQDNPVIQDLTLFAQEWSGGDRLIHLTEGVMVEEERGEPVADEHTSGIHRPGPGEPPAAPSEAPAEAAAAPEAEPPPQGSPIQKFLRRFGIK